MKKLLILCLLFSGCDLKHKSVPDPPKIFWSTSGLPSDFDWGHQRPDSEFFEGIPSRPFVLLPSQWKRLYAEYNSRFFNNELPEENVIILSTECDPENLGETEAKEGVFWMRISPSKHFGDRQARATLLHEMVHISIARKSKQKSYDFSDHGVTFQREMIRIAKLWAFKDAW